MRHARQRLRPPTGERFLRCACLRPGFGCGRMLVCSRECGSTRCPVTGRERSPRPTQLTAPGASCLAGQRGFVGTELYRDAARAGRFLTIERWQDEQDWQSFLTAFGSAYECLDAQLEGLAAAERSLFEGSS
jgi:Antibiotic biosynthesis monooxygenase